MRCNGLALPALAKLVTCSFGRDLERVLCLVEVKRHQLAGPRWLLGLDGVHNGLVRIHDFLNLR